MKKMLFLAILLPLLFSCGEKQPAENVNLHISDSVKIDSLENVIDNLRLTNYDALVTNLKKMPEYKNALFLTPKENKEYLAIASENAKRFETKQYQLLAEFDWYKIDDTTFCKSESYFECQIIFDTTQTLKPLVEVGESWYGTYKDKRTKAEKDARTRASFKYFYERKLGIGYVIATYYQSSLGSSWNTKNYETLNYYMRRGLKK